MDYIELFEKLFETCIIPFLGVMTMYIVSLIKKKTAEISSASKSELEKKYIELLSQTITDCVIATNQTYVDALKKGGKFDAEAQKIAFEKTYNAVISMLTEEAKKYLGEIYGDLDKYITNKIECEVNCNKE